MHSKGTEKKLYHERMEKAAALKEAYEQARADFECLEEIRAVILSHLQAGSNIIHKVYGVGTIVSMKGQAISIQFPAQAEPKKFMLLPSLGGGFLRLGTEDDLIVQSNARWSPYQKTAHAAEALPRVLFYYIQKYCILIQET